MATLNEAIKACDASRLYGDLYASLSQNPRLQCDLESTHLSEALYYHLCRIKYAGWRHRVQFKRGKKHSVADVFQDLLAFYLRAALPEEYEVRLEVAKKAGHAGAISTQADIVILRNGANQFVIEAKTTIGWARPDYKLPLPYHAFSKRIEQVASNFGISPHKVIFVFEEPTNVNKRFLALFWDGAKGAARDNLEFPLSQIYPLFMTTDPYYWPAWPHKPTEEHRISWCPEELTDAEIGVRARSSIVTPLEHIVALIMSP